MRLELLLLIGFVRLQGSVGEGREAVREHVLRQREAELLLRQRGGRVHLDLLDLRLNLRFRLRLVVRRLRLFLRHVVAQYPIYRADAGHVALLAHAVVEEVISDLPGEDARVLVLVLEDLLHHLRRRHLRLAAADRAGPHRARLVVPAEDFAHAAVGDEELARDLRRSYADVRQLDDPLPHIVRQRAAIHEDSSQLIHSAGSCIRLTHEKFSLIILYIKGRYIKSILFQNHRKEN